LFSLPTPKGLVPITVKSAAQLRAMVAALKGVVSFDIETNSLYPWQTHNEKGEPDPAHIHRIGFGCENAQYSIVVGCFDKELLEELIADYIFPALEKCTVVMQNGKFDVLWMMVHFNVRLKLSFDTMLADYAINENRWHDLESLAKYFFGADKWDIPLKTKQGMDKESETLTHYHALDLYWTRKLYAPLRKELDSDEQTARVFDMILMALANMFAEIEYDGVVVDETQFDAAEKVLRTMYAEREAALKKHGDINWGSRDEVANLLFNVLKIKPPVLTKTGKPSTAESALNQIDHECVADLIKFREAKQQLSFFIDGWRPFLHRRKVRGQRVTLLHPSFKLHGTVTGRLSCERPNLQQVPRDPRIRTLITAEPGWTLVECDLSQIELRIVAEVSRDPALVHAFSTGIDVHWLTALSEIERGGALKELVIRTAEQWLDKCGRNADKGVKYGAAIKLLLEAGPDECAELNAEWKEYRKKAKAVNFGYVYGMWWRKFKTYARDNYGVNITDEQAQQSREAFFATYASLDGWHRKQKQFARRNGYVRSLSGRKRRLPSAMIPHDCPERGQAERQAVNSPIQSFGNEINLMTAIQLRSEYPRSVLKICGTVHDAILMRVRNDHVVEVTERCQAIMRKPALFKDFGIELSVPILGDAKVGPWGKGISLDKWRKANGY